METSPWKIFECNYKLFVIQEFHNSMKFTNQVCNTDPLLSDSIAAMILNIFVFFREGEYRFNLFEVQKKRHELIRLYETIDSIRYKLPYLS